jgi:hypothetical protein
VSTNLWSDKVWYIYEMEYYLAMKNEVLIHVNTQINLEIHLWGADNEKLIRTFHKHSCAQWSTGWIWHGPSCRREQEAKCSTAAFPKLFMIREVAMHFSLVTVSCLPQELLLHLLVYLVYHWINKWRTKRFFDGKFWLTVTCLWGFA